jgi:hypothetical protein
MKCVFRVQGRGTEIVQNHFLKTEGRLSLMALGSYCGLIIVGMRETKLWGKYLDLATCIKDVPSKGARQHSCLTIDEYCVVVSVSGRLSVLNGVLDSCIVKVQLEHAGKLAKSSLQVIG